MRSDGTSRVARLAGLGVVLLCAVIAALAVACDDDNGGGSPSTYFADLDRIDREADQRSEETDQELRELFANLGQADETTRDAVADGFSELLTVFSEFIDELEELEPPRIAVDAHDEAVAAFREVETQLAAFLERLREAPPSDVEALLSEETPPDLAAANARATTACEQLETIAGFQQVEIDLNCGTR